MAEAPAPKMARPRGRKKPLPKINLVPKDGVLAIQVPTNLADVFGTSSLEFMEEQVNLIFQALALEGGHPTTHTLQSVIAMVAALKPKNEVEAALALQIAVTHAVSLGLVGDVTRAPNAQLLETRANAATKFQRTFLAQIETFQKMRRGGKQTVVVQHTTVNYGGQAAIIGRMGRGSRRGRSKSEEQSHAAPDERALEPQNGSEVWGQDPLRNAVLFASDEGQAAVPDARRPSRRAEG